MNKNVKKPETAPRRRRRTADVARREILDAAKKRLMEGGPDNVRLKLIGEDVGMSHSSILHHFGSRDGLMEALRSDAFSALAKDLAGRMATPADGDPVVDLFEKISSTLGEQGYARLLAWQLMAGNLPDRASIGKAVFGPDGSGGLLDGLVGQLHGMRRDRAEKHGETEPDVDETRMIVATFACTLLGEALAGHLMVRSAGLGEDAADRKRVRAWMAKTSAALVFPPRASTSGESTANASGPGERAGTSAETDAEPDRES